MNNSSQGSDGKKKLTQLKTFSIPFSLKDFRENITITTNTPSKTSKEQIFKKAIQFHSQGNISEAVKNYRYFINQGFKDHRVFSNYGIILKDLGNLREAELFTRKAIEMKPDFAEAHANLGNVLRDLGEFKEAEISHRKAIELKPHLSTSYRELGICLYLMGKKSSALNSLAKAHSLDPKEIGNQILLNIFQEEGNSKNNDLKTNLDYDKLIENGLDQNPLILNRTVESELIDCLYKINARNQEKYQSPTYGNARGSDYKLFERSESMIKTIKEDLTNISMNSVKSNVLISESFFTIFRSGGGLISHSHLTNLDKIKGIDLARKKFSLVYYLSVGDQNCNEPGILKLENPNQDILPHNGLIVIFPASRKHSVFYKGQKERIIIGVNFYSI